MEATQTVSEERNLLSEIENDINQQPADKDCALSIFCWI
jgi:hypothetical protein